MVIFSNCKINIGLRITGKRVDGYHDLETIFYPLGLKDAIEIMEAPAGVEEFRLISTGIEIPGELSSNLCYKAWRLIKNDFPDIPPVTIYIHKAVPIGAGLGGGSSNGAFTLRLLNEKFELNISDGQLQKYALQLGSDCPFFILNKPCIAKGRGEIMEEISCNLSGYHIALINPGIHISTAWAFSQVKPAPSVISDISSIPVKEWRNHVINDFEEPVFAKYPEIKAIKDEFYKQGAVFAAMTGTGSTVFGIFDRKPPKLAYLYADEISIS